MFRKKDQVRQNDLEDAGFTVLRFTNEEVLESINEVKFKIENWIEKSKSTHRPPFHKDDIKTVKPQDL